MGKIIEKDHWNWRGGKIQVKCCICEKKIKRYASSKTKRPVCGPECNRIRASQDLKGAKSYMWKGGPVTLKCLCCDKLFLAPRANKNRKCCSRACAKKYYVGERSVNWNGGHIWMECPTCKKEFLCTRFHRSQQNYCSNHCANIGNIGMPGKKGKDNPFWKGGISERPYSPDWTMALKKSIRQRDNYKCRLCGKTQKRNRRQLSVHHIDYDKENLDPRNIVSLCGVCHGKTQGDRRRWTRYFKNMMKGVRIA